jgi:hypothetical protein
MKEEQEIIIYNTEDGKASVALFAREGDIWMNQIQLAELFTTSVPNISMHISNILKEKELESISVVKDYLTTAADGKNYNITFYSLDMILAIGFRVRIEHQNPIFKVNNYQNNNLGVSLSGQATRSNLFVGKRRPTKRISTTILNAKPY